MIQSAMATELKSMVDIKQMVLMDSLFGPREVQLISEAIATDINQYRLLREAVGELEQKEELSPAGMVRLGTCQYLLGRYRRAVESLQKGDGGALAHYYLAKSWVALQEYDRALDSYAAAQKAGYDPDWCALGRAEALRLMGKPTEALHILDRLSGAIEETAEYLYQRAATIAALGVNPAEAIALYERAVEVDPNHPGALFGLALENDRQGNDEEAIDLYKRSASRFPPHLGALLNLGILYEDYGQYELAVQCYQRILDAYPDHQRAWLFLRDAQASCSMFLDEDLQKKRDRLSQVLNIPVTDFELSQRSRNCLQKMGIRTLGDLCRTTEQQLLASKNFGETSLQEIREILASKGLSLGMFASEKRLPEPFEPEELSPDQQALLNRPVTDLNLSVRARKCMMRKGISTIGELIRYSGDQLLECKNFGVTSLNEVREKLRQFGLKLRGE
ncbi:MAG: tetratricopeptide repeat protein [Thermoguttaceae bacterium]|nr:tetratricopeptide repeat protein [Thermoguttaceae bacterium]MDW8037943.1 DNA-directed RNA polymerase subunit alpha C-terminal domain-containing protein [Thermoguttaceae bacterium]